AGRSFSATIRGRLRRRLNQASLDPVRNDGACAWARGQLSGDRPSDSLAAASWASAQRRQTCEITPPTTITRAAASAGLGPMPTPTVAMAPTIIWEAPYRPDAVPVRVGS